MNDSSKIPIVISFSVFLCCISLLFILVSSNDQSEFFNGNSAYAQPEGNVNDSRTKLVYHLSTDDPWRATIALLDSQTMLRMGYNVTLMLSIEGVQLGVKNPHHFLGLQPLTRNITEFIGNGGTVVICEVCLKIAGYNNSEILDGAIIGSPKLIANLLNQTTVIDY